MNASNGIPCIIYAAKSTEDLRGSNPDQLRDCRVIVEGDPGRQVVAEYSDEAVSAYHRNRGLGLMDAMQHAEDLAREHGTAELWAQHSDRLARGDGRTARHAVEIALWALKHDVRVRTVQDPDTFRDLLYAVVTGQRNHEDSRRKSLAIAAGLKRAAERGDYLGNRSDGYKLSIEVDQHGVVKKRLVIDPERQELIEMIFRMALRGRRTSAIARAVNDAGWRTNPHVRGQVPRPWTDQRIIDVEKNPRYAGLSVLKGEVLARASWPAYITERQHELIKARLARRRPTKQFRQLETYLLAGVARCGRCGASLWAMTGVQRADGSFGRRYVCASHQRARHAGRCTLPSLDAEKIEAMFVAALPTLLDSPADEPETAWTTAVGFDEPDWTAQRQQVIDAVLAADAQGIDEALARVATRLSPEASLLQHSARSGRHARQLSETTRFRAWADEERAGRTEASRSETRKLNRLLRAWFMNITVEMDDASVEITATRRTAAGGDAPPTRNEAHIDRGELARTARAFRRRYQRWSDAEIVGALQAWADAHGRSPTWTEWVAATPQHPQSITVKRHFRTWGRALRQAGLKPNEPAVLSRNQPWTDAEVLHTLTVWASEHGRSPTWAEWLKATPEHPCTNTLREHFGSWQAGIAAAGLEYTDGRHREPT